MSEGKPTPPAPMSSELKSALEAAQVQGIPKLDQIIPHLDSLVQNDGSVQLRERDNGNMFPDKDGPIGGMGSAPGEKESHNNDPNKTDPRAGDPEHSYPERMRPFNTPKPEDPTGKETKPAPNYDWRGLPTKSRDIDANAGHGLTGRMAAANTGKGNGLA